MGSVLVTGGEGLVGTPLCRRLLACGHDISVLDTRAVDPRSRGDVRDTVRLRTSLEGCDGVVHLAAVSRVVLAEREPVLCEATNVDALRTLIQLSLASVRRPWIVFASSREVYGQADRLPVVEDTPLAPVNVYGRSKVAGEQLCALAREAGLRTAIARLSNVYGSVHDHADRVVPAFVRAALAGRSLRLDGAESTFDFTHVDDAADGIARMVDALARERRLPPIHFTTGVATSLEALAAMVIRTCGASAVTELAPARRFDVATFVGDPGRAESILGWRATTPLQAGIARLASDFRSTSEASEQ